MAYLSFKVHDQKYLATFGINEISEFIKLELKDLPSKKDTVPPAQLDFLFSPGDQLPSFDDLSKFDPDTYYKVFFGKR